MAKILVYCDLTMCKAAVTFDKNRLLHLRYYVHRISGHSNLDFKRSKASDVSIIRGFDPKLLHVHVQLRPIHL